MSGILVETTRNDLAIPGDDAGMPELPAMIGKFVFNSESTI